MKIIYAEAEAFAKNGPDEASLNKVKEYMLKKHNENLKENGYWLNSIDEYLYTGINPIKDYEQIINGITAKDIQKICQRTPEAEEPNHCFNDQPRKEIGVCIRSRKVDL